MYYTKIYILNSYYLGNKLIILPDDMLNLGHYWFGDD